MKQGESCIDKVPIFKLLTYEEKIEIARVMRSRKYKKGEIIYYPGDEENQLLVLHEGKIKVSRVSREGKEQIIRILGRGDILGELALLLNKPYENTAEALEDTEVCLIRGEDFKELLIKSPIMSVKIIEELSKRLQESENIIEGMGILTAEERLARKLISLKNEDDIVELDMTKGQLASMLGMSGETLSRQLSLLQDRKAIELVGHRKIIIRDIEKLS